MAAPQQVSLMQHLQQGPQALQMVGGDIHNRKNTTNRNYRYDDINSVVP
jgi:hypothetical protein